jgi:hypothetical protein
MTPGEDDPDGIIRDPSSRSATAGLGLLQHEEENKLLEFTCQIFTVKEHVSDDGHG